MALEFGRGGCKGGDSERLEKRQERNEDSK